MLYGPLDRCPKCGQAESFGRTIFRQRGLTLRCKKCGHTEVKNLPPITKKIIYIDQFALSKMVKNKDEPFWAELHDRLTRLSANEIITCPYSPIHIEESEYDYKLRDALKAMYRRIAGDDQFRRPQDVEQRQLARSLRAYIGCTKSKPTYIRIDDAFEKSPHRWSEVLNIYADMGYSEELIDGLRRDKESAHSSMQSLCDRWRASPVEFDAQVEAEAAAFQTHVAAYRQLSGGNLNNFCRFSSPIVLDVVDWLAHTVLMIDPDETDPVSILEGFAASQQLRETPWMYLNCRIWAKIAELVCNPKGPRKPRLGDRYDADVLASYAPYCDAMFIDGGFREIAIDSRIGCEKRFGVKIFSEQVRDSFVTYLDELERNTPNAHWEAYAFVHGNDPRERDSSATETVTSSAPSE